MKIISCNIFINSNYEIRQQTFVWPGMPLFIWINNMTLYKCEVFANTAFDFLNNRASLQKH